MRDRLRRGAGELAFPGGMDLRYARVEGYRDHQSAAEADTYDRVRVVFDRGRGPSAPDEITSLEVGGDAAMTPITIYTTSWCRYCKAAKRLLDRKGIDYAEVDIESWDDPWVRLHDLTGGTSVPQIVAAEVPVGGYDDLCALDRSGTLDTLTSGPS